MLRAMTMADLDAVCQIEEQCFSVPWSRESMEKELSGNDQAHYLVAEIAGQVVGYAGFWQVLDEGHIMNIAVLPEMPELLPSSDVLPTRLISVGMGSSVSFPPSTQMTMAPSA